jgi:hypothetical protein
MGSKTETVASISKTPIFRDKKNKYCASKPHLPLSFLITLVAYSCRLGRRPYARMRRVCDLAVCAPLAKEFLGGRWSRGQGGS